LHSSATVAWIPDAGEQEKITLGKWIGPQYGAEHFRRSLDDAD
jgi:hypothetical protein